MKMFDWSLLIGHLFCWVEFCYVCNVPLLSFLFFETLYGFLSRRSSNWIVLLYQIVVELF